MTTYVARAHYAVTTTADMLPRATGEHHSPAARWTYHTVGSAAAWLSTLACFTAVVMVVLTAIAVRAEAWIAATVLAGFGLTSLAGAVCLALTKIVAAIASRAAVETEQRVISQLTQQLEQQIGALYRAVPRECREAVKRQGEQLRAELADRVDALEQQCQEINEEYERGFVEGAAKVADTLVPAGGIVRQIRPPSPRRSR